MKAAGDALEEQLGRLSEQAEDINSAQNVSLREIQEERERLWKEYRQTLAAAFDALKPIFHDLDD